VQTSENTLHIFGSKGISIKKNIKNIKEIHACVNYLYIKSLPDAKTVKNYIWGYNTPIKNAFFAEIQEANLPEIIKNVSFLGQ
jgi:hypothetical protein